MHVVLCWELPTTSGRASSPGRLAERPASVSPAALWLAVEACVPWESEKLQCVRCPQMPIAANVPRTSEL